jgi:hypothetical protein
MQIKIHVHVHQSVSRIMIKFHRMGKGAREAKGAMGVVKGGTSAGVRFATE